MSDTVSSSPIRSWREVAKDAAAERDPDKELELAQELIRALDAELIHLPEQVKIDDELKKKAA
jgi:hypothetical protein